MGASSLIEFVFFKWAKKKERDIDKVEILNDFEFEIWICSIWIWIPIPPLPTIYAHACDRFFQACKTQCAAFLTKMREITQTALIERFRMNLFLPLWSEEESWDKGLNKKDELMSCELAFTGSRRIILTLLQWLFTWPHTLKYTHEWLS